ELKILGPRKKAQVPGGFHGLFKRLRLWGLVPLERLVKNTAVHGRRRSHTENGQDSWRDVDIAAGHLINKALFDIGSGGHQGIVQIESAEGSVGAVPFSAVD